MDNSNNNNAQSSGDILSWLIVFICLFAAPPLGVILLLVKLSKTGKAKGQNANRYYRNNRNTWSNQYYQAQQAKTGQNYYTAHQSRPNASYQPGQQYYQQKQNTQAGQNNQSGQYHQTPPSQAAAQSGSPGAAAPPNSAASQASTGQAYSAHQQQAVNQQPYRPYQKYQAQSTPSQPSYQYYNVRKPNEKKLKKEEAKAAKKHNGKGLSGLLMFLGILFAIAATIFLSLGLSSYAAIGMLGATITMAIFSALFYSSAIFSFIGRGIVQRRFRRFNKYAAVIGSRDTMPIAEIARAVGDSTKKTEKTLQDMIDSGYFGPLAYIDSGLDSFVISREAADKERQAKDTAKAGEGDKPVGSDNQYVAVINELHMLCAQTSDPSICAKIARIEEVTAKIFKIVEDKPEKAPQIRRFMNYYLPTTMKLLHSYETLEKQDIRGENITSAKQDIERVLDTLTAGYEQQLDNLFRADAIDISADINVLENLMEQDGLTSEGNIMKMSDGTTVKTSDGGTLKAAGGN